MSVRRTMIKCKTTGNDSQKLTQKCLILVKIKGNPATSAKSGFCSRNQHIKRFPLILLKQERV